MATYKGIQGYSVQSLASDPTASEVVGQLWYNSTSNVWKVALESSGSWASKNSLNNARNSSAGFGITTAAVDVGGNVPYTAATEEFDGTTWTEVTAYPSVISGAGSFGTQTTGVLFGGAPPSDGANALTFEYNGSSWTAGGALNTARTCSGGGAGTQTAGLGAGGGYPAPVGNQAETYNGTAWTTVNLLSNNMRSRAGCGQQTTALAIGGYAIPAVAIQDLVESYDGSSWSEATVLNRVTTVGGAGGASNTSALFFGGSIPGQTPKTQQWNGSTWTEVGDLVTSRYGPAGLHGQVTTASQLAMAGGFSGSPNYSDACEEWSEPSYVVSTVTTS